MGEDYKVSIQFQASTDKAKDKVQKLGDTIKNKVSKATEKATQEFSNMGKSAASSVGSIMKKFALLAIGVRSVMALFRKMRATIVDSVGEVAKISPTFNENISKAYSSLQYLKRSFASMFLPIIQGLSGAFSKIVDMAGDAFSTIAQYIAGIFGQKTFFRAKKYAYDYAETLGTAADNAKELNGTLAGFDTVMNIGGSDSNSGSSGYTGPSPDELWEEVEVNEEIEKKTKKISENLKEWKKTLVNLFDKLKKDLPGILTTVGNVALKIGEWATNIDNAKSSAVLLGGSIVSSIIWPVQIVYELGKTIYNWLVDTWNSVATSSIGKLLSMKEVPKVVFKDSRDVITDWISGNTDGNLIDGPLGYFVGGIETSNTQKNITAQSVGVNAGMFKDFSAPAHANGGFPEDGPFYMNKGELFGKFSDGRSVVANNQQITDGIADAVYSAIISANGSNSGKPQTIQVNVDGDKLFSFVVNKNQEKIINTGFSPLMI